MPEEPQEPEVLHQFGELIRVVVDERTDTDALGRVSVHLMIKGNWRSIAVNGRPERGNLDNWSRNAIDKYVKRWRHSVDKRATELQAELEELVQIEEIFQREVGVPNP
jgi:hypothetical protein